MTLWQRLKTLFRKKMVQQYPHTDPSQPDFDIHAWLRMGQEIEERYPHSPGVKELRAYGQGFSDCLTPEEDAEQTRRMAEMERQEAEAKRPRTESARRTS